MIVLSSAYFANCKYEMGIFVASGINTVHAVA